MEILEIQKQISTQLEYLQVAGKGTVLLLRIFLTIALISISAAAHAADAQAAPPQATRIVTDQKAGVIRFIVNGREEARLDAKGGLHVRGGIEYGDALISLGPKLYDKQYDIQARRTP